MILKDEWGVLVVVKCTDSDCKILTTEMHSGFSSKELAEAAKKIIDDTSTPSYVYKSASVIKIKERRRIKTESNKDRLNKILVAQESLRSNPEEMTEILIAAKILDKDGHLMPHYNKALK